MVDVINPSITANIGTQQQVNPLAMLGQFAQTQNALNQNALFQQTFRARQALGPIAQQSLKTDPVTGEQTMDWGKYIATAASHPETAFMAADIANNVAQKQNLDANTLHTQIENKRMQMEGLAGIYGAASQDPKMQNAGSFTSEGYASQMHELGIPSTDIITMLADPKQLGGLTDADLRQYFKMHSLALTHGSTSVAALNANFKDDAFHDPNTGAPIPGWVNPNVQSAVPAVAGIGGSLSAGPTGGAPALNALQPTQGASGANPLTGAPAPTVQPAAPAASAPVLGPVGPLQKEQLAEIPEYQKDVDSRQSSAQALLLQMQQAQRMLKNFTPNGAANVRAELGRIANGMGAPKELQDELTNGSIDNTQAAQKTLFGIGSQLAAQLIHAGGGRLSQTEWAKTLDIGSPNIDMTPGAISKIMTSMREMAHVTDMERTHLYGRLQQAQNGQYNITNVKNDWAKTLNGYIDAREGQEQ